MNFTARQPLPTRQAIQQRPKRISANFARTAHRKQIVKSCNMQALLRPAATELQNYFFRIYLDCALAICASSFIERSARRVSFTRNEQPADKPTNPTAPRIKLIATIDWNTHLYCTETALAPRMETTLA